ncbi:galactose mutarotase [bacterium]|nr:galactose mutarotase [bacterium]
MKKMLSCLLLAFPISFCTAAEGTGAEIRMRLFGSTPQGEEVFVYTLENGRGMKAEIINYGGAVTRLLVPDRKGIPADMVLGFDNLEDYVTRSPFFGCIIGRFGNRIANGRFTLDDSTYTLPINNRPGGIPCHLHGGKGFGERIWEAAPRLSGGCPELELSRISPDGEEGYPGNLEVKVVYRLTEANELEIQYRAKTDKPTPVNLTNHSYFNLHGEGNGNILDHVLWINAKSFTPVNAGLIPTGSLMPVTGTPFHFLEPRPIGYNIDVNVEQLRFGGGYDHNFVLDRKGRELELAAALHDPASGRYMEVWTTEPGLQFYSGNFLDGTLTGKSGIPYGYRTGLCLETQHFPDSPNQPSFPNTILRPGELYESTTVYGFSVK